jgi:hypothetical protein
MLGVLVVPRRMPIGTAIDQILMIAVCTTGAEWVNQVRFLPINW